MSSGNPIETIDITEDEPEVLNVVPSTLDIDKIRQNEESRSDILVAARLSQPVLQNELEKLHSRLTILSAEGYKEQELTSVKDFFQNVLLNVSNEQDRSSIISRRHAQIESKHLGLLPLRICAFNFAIDYNNGSNQQLIKFREEVLSQKSKAIDEQLINLQNQIQEKQSQLDTYEKDIIEETSRIDELIKSKIGADEFERERQARQAIEDAKNKKREEEEIQYQQEIAEKQRLLKLKEEEEQKAIEEEKAKKKAENDMLMDRLKKQGYSEETSYLIDQNTKIPQDEVDESTTAKPSTSVKSEENANDRLEQLQKMFRENDKSGRHELRKRRAERRKAHALRRKRGEPNVSSDDEWREDIDGVFSDEDQHNGNGQSNIDSDIDMIDSENEAFHVPEEEQNVNDTRVEENEPPKEKEVVDTQNQVGTDSSSTSKTLSPQRNVAEPSPSYPIESTHDLNPQPSYLMDQKVSRIQPREKKKDKEREKSKEQDTKSPKPASKLHIMNPTTIPTKRPNPIANDQGGLNILSRPKDPRVRKRGRDASGYFK